MLKLQLIGNLGKDAEVRSVNGRFVINFTVAVSESYTNKEGTKIENTTWIECAIWKNEGQGTKIADFLKKGTKVYVSGAPEVNAYLDKDNKAAASQKLRVQDIELLGSKSENAGPPAVSSGATAATPADDDEVPF